MYVDAGTFRCCPSEVTTHGPLEGKQGRRDINTPWTVSIQSVQLIQCHIYYWTYMVLYI